MRTTLLLLLSFWLLGTSGSVHAGNGVERGSVMIKTSGETPEISEEIFKYLSKQLIRCTSKTVKDYFKVTDISVRREKIDQGIIDYFYKIKLNHLSANDESLNVVTVEILDSDFDNWRDYEEKLSLEILNDQNNRCL